MKLQKLVYIAHGYCLALRDSPMISEPVRAWQYGPVFKRLYKKLSIYGAGEVTSPIVAEDSVPDECPEHEIIEAVWQTYRQMSGGQLSTITHREGTPWSSVWIENEYARIPDELIAKYYRDILAGSVEGR